MHAAYVSCRMILNSGRISKYQGLRSKMVVAYASRYTRHLFCLNRIGPPISCSNRVLLHTLFASSYRSPSTGASISYTKSWINPFPRRFVYGTALTGGFARRQFRDPIKTELDRVHCFNFARVSLGNVT